ncbi:MAG: carbonic anhydrase [Myxococcales bacterium]
MPCVDTLAINGDGEVHAHTEEITEALPPADALEIQFEGNERFNANLKANRNRLQQENETRDGSFPSPTFHSCIGSGTSTEQFFEQGLGELFSGRIAGIYLSEDIRGSLGFASRIAGAKHIVLLGHSRCDAIKGACDNVELGHLAGMLRKIAPAVDSVVGSIDAALCTSDNEKLDDAAATENEWRRAKAIPERSGVLQEMKAAGEIEVVGGFYEVTNGLGEGLPWSR